MGAGGTFFTSMTESIRKGMMAFALSAQLRTGGAFGNMIGAGIGGVMSAGSAIGKFGGMVGRVAGGLGLGGVAGVGLGAYELSKHMGIAGENGAIQNMIDPVGAAVDRTVRSLKIFDESLANAAQRVSGGYGAGSTREAGGFMKWGEDITKQIEALKDVGGWKPGYGNPNADVTAKQRARYLRERLEGTGVTETDVNKWAGMDATGRALEMQRLMARKAQSGGIHYKAIADTNSGLDRLTANDKQIEALKKDTVFWGKAQNAVLTEMNKSMQDGKGELTYSQIRKVIMMLARVENVDDKIGTATPPKQTVNINIQQVTAKDPNRWLAEMDDMVQKRTRAPTRAKRALKNTKK